MTAGAALAGPAIGTAAQPRDRHRIEIRDSVLELGRGVKVYTTAYDGRFPGPLLRLKEGDPVHVEARNMTARAEQLHWHGQFLPPDIDGAAEEGTPFIPAHRVRRFVLKPRPSGFRFFHTHVTAGTDLSRGLYSGQVGLVYIDPRHGGPSHDREVFLTLKEFGPYLNMNEMASSFMAPQDRVRRLYDLDQQAIRAARARGREPGHQLGYRYHTINGRMLGSGEPVRVRSGERVLFHILNASATEIRSLALPGHVFEVVAMDGNPVPRPASVPVLWLGPGERISATVTMNQPGVWVLGEPDPQSRDLGMGIVVEYAGRRGPPGWRKPPPSQWDYRRFTLPGAKPRRVDETIDLTFQTQYSARAGFDVFTINGVPFSMERMEPRFRLRYGSRYRLTMHNATDDVHPIHLHRHTFEVTRIGNSPTAGLMKDVVMIGPFQEMSIDFVADQKGLSLFHCHMQDHMDFGFMALFDCS